LISFFFVVNKFCSSVLLHLYQEFGRAASPPLAARVGLSAPSPSRLPASQSVATVVPLLSLSLRGAKQNYKYNKRVKSSRPLGFVVFYSRQKNKRLYSQIFAIF
jgi:hypothetical protein